MSPRPNAFEFNVEQAKFDPGELRMSVIPFVDPFGSSQVLAYTFADHDEYILIDEVDKTESKQDVAMAEDGNTEDPLPGSFELDTANVVNDDIVEPNTTTAQDTLENDESNEGRQTPVATLMIPQLVGSKKPRTVSECGAPPFVFRRIEHPDQNFVLDTETFNQRGTKGNTRQ